MRFNDPLGDEPGNGNNYTGAFNSAISEIGMIGPHDTGDPNRIYRYGDPEGYGMSRRHYAQHFDWVASHPTDYQKNQAMARDANWVQKGRMSHEEYGAKYAFYHVSKYEFDGYAKAANAAKDRYIRSILFNKTIVLASLNGMEDLGPQTQGHGPSRAELMNRFGDSFHKLFWDPMMSQFSGKTVDISDVEKFISDFDYGALQDNGDGSKYSLQLAISRVAVMHNGQITYDSGVVDWTAGGFWRPPYDKSGTAFNPTIGLVDGPMIYFQDISGKEYAVGVLLRISTIY